MKRGLLGPHVLDEETVAGIFSNFGKDNVGNKGPTSQGPADFYCLLFFFNVTFTFPTCPSLIPQLSLEQITNIYLWQVNWQPNLSMIILYFLRLERKIASLLIYRKKITYNYAVWNIWEIFFWVRIILLVILLVGSKALPSVKVKPDMKVLSTIQSDFPANICIASCLGILYSASCLRLYSVNLGVFWGLFFLKIEIMPKNHQ